MISLMSMWWRVVRCQCQYCVVIHLRPRSTYFREFSWKPDFSPWYCYVARTARRWVVEKPAVFFSTIFRLELLLSLDLPQRIEDFEFMNTSVSLPKLLASKEWSRNYIWRWRQEKTFICDRSEVGIKFISKWNWSTKSSKSWRQKQFKNAMSRCTICSSNERA